MLSIVFSAEITATAADAAKFPLTLTNYASTRVTVPDLAGQDFNFRLLLVIIYA